ncbi:MAG TPA: vanadium-dependent haloperoxidase [Candidatus Binatia bacterium]|nr:vanadium-dependent haloperoxidase [Candidatus Binatia bacterium]
MPDPDDPSRRAVLKAGATAAGVLALGRADGLAAGLGRLEAETLRLRRGATGARGFRRRRRAALEYRRHCATLATRRNRPLAVPVANGEETELAGHVASFSKGLPHDALGHVDPAAYAALLAAVRSGDPADFERIPMAGTLRLTSPQAGLAFDLEGPDAASVALRPAPRFDSAENAAEMAELYWMSLARDVPFAAYASDPTIAAAAADLSRFSDFRGPKEGGVVTPGTIFRGSAAGNLVGPFVSQFLWRDVPYGALRISAQIATVLPGVDYLTRFDEWLAVQNGARSAGGDLPDLTPRYIRSLRDLAAWVHGDALYQAYLNACLVLLALGAPLDPGLPPRRSRNQDGFVEFGAPHVLSLVTEVATRALKAVWFEKWFVHRRLRPEEFGGRVHNLLTGAVLYPIHRELLDSPVLGAVRDAHGSYLLPQAFPEGCPCHPAYGSGHATVAGACVTVLKAFFDDQWVLPELVAPNADGTRILRLDGPPLTVGGELDKLAANVATGRNAAGIHWRTDFSEAILLGEAIALGILEEQKLAHNERFTYSLTRFDGTRVTV